MKRTLRSFAGESSGAGGGRVDKSDPPTRSTDATIEGLLRENGGRLRQQAIVAAVRRSEATVSRTLSEMEAQGRVRRIAVGRQKIVCLPDRVPEPYATE